MVKIAVTGAAGRMGRSIIGIINETEGASLTGAIEREDSPFIGSDAGEVAGIGRLGIPITEDFEKAVKSCDVIIDFSIPEASIRHLEGAVNHKRAIVIGTTGFSRKQRSHIRELGSQTRCLISPNMSLGINLLLRVLPEMAKVLGNEFDIEIIEAHHRLKKDAPSGTALRLAEAIAHALGRDLENVAVYERRGMTGERRREEIGIQTIRAGDIVGEHTVIFGGLGERIEITHRAHSRDTFARGAVKAAMWLVGQPAGIYDMQDVLKI